MGCSGNLSGRRAEADSPACCRQSPLFRRGDRRVWSEALRPGFCTTNQGLDSYKSPQDSCLKMQGRLRRRRLHLSQSAATKLIITELNGLSGGSGEPVSTATDFVWCWSSAYVFELFLCVSASGISGPLNSEALSSAPLLRFLRFCFAIL